MNYIIEMLDSIADSLEHSGLLKEAMDIDVLSNTLESSYFDHYRDKIDEYLNKAIKNPSMSLVLLESIINEGLPLDNKKFCDNFSIAYRILRSGRNDVIHAYKDAKEFIEKALRYYTPAKKEKTHNYTYFNS